MEFTLIDRIRARTALARADVRLGIGDDAAVVAVPADHELVMALDTLVEGVHFPRGTAPADIGWKALAVNLSDLAAMGAAPAWAMLGLTLPAPELALLDGLAEGFAALAHEHGLALVGGDTTRGPLTLSVAVHGLVPAGQALRRAGAQPGDAILVTGSLGDAGAGLRLVRGEQAGVGTPDGDWLRRRLDRPLPRVAAGQVLRGLASACIDVSDGLLADLGHLCRASDVAAVVDAEALPLSPALRALVGAPEARRLGLTAGDDYELCFTVAPARCDAAMQALAGIRVPATRIGRVTAGSGVSVTGLERPPGDAGWDHFREN